MPFTASHPALIIPLLKSRYFSASGLILGSMIPDFEFILLMKTEVVYGHSILPMFWLNLPLSIILLFLFHNVVRKSLILNLPEYFKKRLLPFIHFNWNRYFKENFVKIILSILLGNLGHLFWDAFTHSHGIFVEWMSFLQYPILNVPLYHVLQYGFSLLGAWVLWVFFRKLPYKNLSIDDRKKKLYWFVVVIIALGILFFRLKNVQKFYFEEWVICGLCAFMAGLLAASIFDLFYSTKERETDQVKPINIEADY